MTGAQKRTTLLRLSEDAERADLGAIAAALTQISGLDLDDAAVCRKWANACDSDGAIRKGDGRAIMFLAAHVLGGTLPS